MSTSDDRIKALEDQIRRLKRGALSTKVLLLPCFFISIYLFLFAIGGMQAGALPGTLRAESFRVADPDIELSVASLDHDHISGARLGLDGLVVDGKKRHVSITPSRIQLRQNDWVDGAFAGGGVDLILIEVADDGPRMTFRNQDGEVTGVFP